MGPFDTSWLIATISLSVPILLAAIGELVSERTGVMNVGIEGMMITGAFFGFYVTWLTGSVFVGVLGGAAAGLAMAAIVGLVSISGTGDQVIVGVAVWILGLGMTSFLNARIFAQGDQVVVATLSPVAIPGLERLPVIGRALFDQSLLAYFAFAALFAVAFVLRRTNWGLIIRSTGEAPAAVDNAGISVSAVRWLGVLTAGAFAGLGGVMLTIGASGTFAPNVTAGQGFIALAAVFFGRWRPFGVLGACLVFGGAFAFQLKLQTYDGVPPQVWLVCAVIAVVTTAALAFRRRRLPTLKAGLTAGTVVLVGVALAIIDPNVSVPTQVWLMVPYIVTLAVLTGLAGTTRGPHALAVHYERAA